MSRYKKVDRVGGVLVSNERVIRAGWCPECKGRLYPRGESEEFDDEYRFCFDDAEAYEAVGGWIYWIQRERMCECEGTRDMVDVYGEVTP